MLQYKGSTATECVHLPQCRHNPSAPAMLQRTLHTISRQFVCPTKVHAIVSRAAPVIDQRLLTTSAFSRKQSGVSMDPPQGEAQTGSPTRSPKRRKLADECQPRTEDAPSTAAAAAAPNAQATVEPRASASRQPKQQAGTPASGTVNGAAKSAGAAVANGTGDAGGKKAKKPRGIAGNPKKERLHEIVKGIHMSAKHNDLAAAMGFFESAVSEDLMPIRVSEFNSLMYLAVGGDRWETLARGAEPDVGAVANVRGNAAVAADAPAVTTSSTAANGGTEAGVGTSSGSAATEGGSTDAQGGEAATAAVPEETMSEQRARHVAAATRVWGVMQEHSVKPDAGSYLALARMEGIRQEPKAALAWVHKAKDAGEPLQLRLFHPALVGFCLQKQSASIMELDAYINKQGLECLDLTEYEFRLLVEGLAADPAATWQQLRGVLQRMATELNELSPTTIELLSAYFNSSRGAAAVAADADLDPEGATVPRCGWKVERVEVDKSGRCEAAGGSLRRVELEEAEWESFAQGVASLGQKDDRGKRDFSAYMEWLARNGPYDILLDCANVAFYGQNRAGGGFNWGQVMRMVDKVKRSHPDKRLLVMVHRKRLYDPEAKAHEVQKFLDSLRAQKAFYYTPPGSNDDWYWMYAAVMARSRGMLISNDELRDHIWSLLRPKHFLKWKAGHITHYSFPGPDTYPTLLLPPSFTSCIQRLEESGAWMFPSTEEGRWLCVRPV